MAAEPRLSSSRVITSRTQSYHSVKSDQRRPVHVLPEEFQFCTSTQSISGAPVFGQCWAKVHYGLCSGFESFIVETTGSSSAPSATGRITYTVTAKSPSNSPLQASMNDGYRQQQQLSSRRPNLSLKLDTSPLKGANNYDWPTPPMSPRSMRERIHSAREDIRQAMELLQDDPDTPTDDLQSYISDFVREDRLRNVVVVAPGVTNETVVVERRAHNLHPINSSSTNSNNTHRHSHEHPQTFSLHPHHTHHERQRSLPELSTSVPYDSIHYGVTNRPTTNVTTSGCGNSVSCAPTTPTATVNNSQADCELLEAENELFRALMEALEEASKKVDNTTLITTTTATVSSSTNSSSHFVDTLLSSGAPKKRIVLNKNQADLFHRLQQQQQYRQQQQSVSGINGGVGVGNTDHWRVSKFANDVAQQQQQHHQQQQQQKQPHHSEYSHQQRHPQHDRRQEQEENPADNHDYSPHPPQSAEEEEDARHDAPQPSHARMVFGISPKSSSLSRYAHLIEQRAPSPEVIRCYSPQPSQERSRCFGTTTGKGHLSSTNSGVVESKNRIESNGRTTPTASIATVEGELSRSREQQRNEPKSGVYSAPGTQQHRQNSGAHHTQAIRSNHRRNDEQNESAVVVNGRDDEGDDYENDENDDDDDELHETAAQRRPAVYSWRGDAPNVAASSSSCSSAAAAVAADSSQSSTSEFTVTPVSSCSAFAGVVSQPLHNTQHHPTTVDSSSCAQPIYSIDSPQSYHRSQQPTSNQQHSHHSHPSRAQSTTRPLTFDAIDQFIEENFADYERRQQSGGSEFDEEEMKLTPQSPKMCPLTDDEKALLHETLKVGLYGDAKRLDNECDDENSSQKGTSRRIIVVSKPAPKPEPKPEPKFVNGKVVFGQVPVKQSRQRGSVAERVMLFEKCPEKTSVTKHKLTELQSKHRITNPNKIGNWIRMGADVDTKIPKIGDTTSSVRTGAVAKLVLNNLEKIQAKIEAAGGDEPRSPLTPTSPFRRFSRSNSLVPGQVPRFHFPCGRPYSSTEVEAQIKRIAGVFERFPSRTITRKEIGSVLKMAGIPVYWKEPLFRAVVAAVKSMPPMLANGNGTPAGSRRGSLASRSNSIDAGVNGGPFVAPNGQEFITSDQFTDYWKRLISTCYDEASRFVTILSEGKRQHLLPEDFEALLQDVIDTHPGLAFLKEAEEFHSRYIHTVIARIFYCLDLTWSGVITLAALRKSNFLKVMRALEAEDDINQITDYFSYEHFYVIYCKFWELDADHDLFISKHDLAKHNDSAISSRMIDRIFCGAVTRGSRAAHNRMSYAEFVWFLLSEEDKRHPRSIEYWFRCMDLDGDGFLSMYELEYFYTEQVKRMEAAGIEALPFPDCLCQMMDLASAKNDGKISLADLKRCKLTTVFFDTFFNLEKYLDHEQRDPFASRDEEGLSDWDRYAAEEYELLVAEENAQNGSNHFKYHKSWNRKRIRRHLAKHKHKQEQLQHQQQEEQHQQLQHGQDEQRQQHSQHEETESLNGSDVDEEEERETNESSDTTTTASGDASDDSSSQPTSPSDSFESDTSSDHSEVPSLEPEEEEEESRLAEACESSAIVLEQTEESPQETVPEPEFCTVKSIEDDPPEEELGREFYEFLTREFVLPTGLFQGPKVCYIERSAMNHRDLNNNPILVVDELDSLKTLDDEDFW